MPDLGLTKSMKRILFTLLVALATLVLFELYLRSTRIHITSNKLQSSAGVIEITPEALFVPLSASKRFIPNADATIHNHYLSGLDVPIKTNSLGMRDDQIIIPKPDDEIRIVMLGDSITVSEYLPREATFVELLQEHLKAGSPKKINVINAGIIDIGITESLDRLEELLPSLQPDIVILDFYLNDARPSWGFPQEERHRNWFRRNLLTAEIIYQQFQLSDWIKKEGADRFGWIELAKELRWKSSQEEFKRLTESARYDWGSAWLNDSWDKFSLEFARFKKLSERNSFKPAIVIFPVSYQVESDFADNTPQVRAVELAKQLEVRSLDLLPVMRNARSDKLFYDQCHPNIAGHKLIADSIAAWIKPELGLEAEPGKAISK